MGDNGGADLISELPDEVLLHILSFLDEMVVVRSSVLSKRWRYLWTFISFPTKMKEDKLFFMWMKKNNDALKLIIHEEGDTPEGDTPEVNYTSIWIYRVVTRIYLPFCLPLFFILEFRSFVCIIIGMTLFCMGLICSDWCLCCFELSRLERCLKRVHKFDLLLTSQINSISRDSPLMKPMVPVNVQSKRALSKSYALCGMLVIMILSCSLTILSWKFELGTQ